MIFFQVIDHLQQKNSERQDFGLDLLAINIQRGRSLIPYASNFRILCRTNERNKGESKEDNMQTKLLLELHIFHFLIYVEDEWKIEQLHL